MRSLMHPRVAANYAAKGYYPTDDATLRGIAHLLAPSVQAIFFDPTCGGGEALAALSNKRSHAAAKRYGIEIDAERAQIAQGNLDQVLHASVLDAQVAAQSVSCLFLNPPYGWSIKEDGANAERLEHQILHQSFSCLKAGGVMIAILPKGAIDRKTQNWLAMRFERIRVFAAATDRFQQIVIVGIKRGMPSGVDKAFNTYMDVRLKGEIPFDELPTASWPEHEQYRLPVPERTFRMTAKALDIEGLEAVKQECVTLWQDFDKQFCCENDIHVIRPLHDLTDWHTCLMISSGVVGGVVDNGKRRLLIKGRTHKVQVIKTLEDPDGNVVSEQHRDRFETVIKAIDLTCGSPRYGNVFEIR